MNRKHWAAGWTRIGEIEFKAGITAALKEQPDICARMRHAVRATAARKGVRPELVAQYLRWLDEVESAEKAMGEAVHPVAAKAATTPSK